jgi:hypothetical protein
VFCRSERAQRALIQARAQALAPNHLHHVVETAARQTTEVVDRDDVGVADASDQLGFHLKATRQIRVFAQLSTQHLDRHGPAQSLVDRRVHHPHGALSKPSRQLVFAKDCARA